MNQYIDINFIYTVNNLGQGQASNVNCAFQAATQPRLILIHDDDYFLPGGIDALARGWDGAHGELDAVFGRQKIVDAEGIELAEATRGNEIQYKRHLPPGMQPSPLWSALHQQFPNNGYMLARDFALSIGYPSEVEVGRHAVDFHFGLNLAMAAKKGFLMIPEYVSCYRLSPQSVGRGVAPSAPNLNHLGFEAILRAREIVQVEAAGFEHALNHHAAGAVVSYLEQRDPERAAEILRAYPAMAISHVGRLRLLASVALMRIGLPWLSDRVRTWRAG